MKKIRRNYSLDINQSEELSNILGVSQELGICKESLQRWKREYKQDKLTNSKLRQLIKTIWNLPVYAKN